MDNIVTFARSSIKTGKSVILYSDGYKKTVCQRSGNPFAGRRSSFIINGPFFPAYLLCLAGSFIRAVSLLFRLSSFLAGDVRIGILYKTRIDHFVAAIKIKLSRY